jgi:signal transduction histidine kinase
LSNPTETTDCELRCFANDVNRGAATSAVCYWELECSRIKLEKGFMNFLPNGYDVVLRPRSHEKAVFGSSQWLPDIIGIRVKLDPEAPKIFRITVEDSGGGIPADIIEKVVQPFFTTRSCVGSTGLGLAISRATVESLKGMIEVSNAGRGARFVVSLPIHTTAEAVPVSA